MKFFLFQKTFKKKIYIKLIQNYAKLQIIHSLPSIFLFESSAATRAYLLLFLCSVEPSLLPLDDVDFLLSSVDVRPIFLPGSGSLAFFFCCKVSFLSLSEGAALDALLSTLESGCRCDLQLEISFFILPYSPNFKESICESIFISKSNTFSLYPGFVL